MGLNSHYSYLTHHLQTERGILLIASPYIIPQLSFFLFSPGWVQPIKTSASSVFRKLDEFDTGNLIDGNLGRTDSESGDCFVTHTWHQGNHFVELELDVAYNITAVAILNRIGLNYSKDLLKFSIFPLYLLMIQFGLYAVSKA